jgi:hypothetical protein
MVQFGRKGDLGSPGVVSESGWAKRKRSWLVRKEKRATKEIGFWGAGREKGADGRVWSWGIGNNC